MQCRFCVEYLPCSFSLFSRPSSFSRLYTALSLFLNIALKTLFHIRLKNPVSPHLIIESTRKGLLQSETELFTAQNDSLVEDEKNLQVDPLVRIDRSAGVQTHAL